MSHDDAPRVSSESPRLTSLAALEDAAHCLRSLAHPHRLRMVQMLLQGSYTVGELAEACDIPPHHASQHLGQLRDRGLLHASRDGRTVLYTVSQPALAGILSCIEANFGVDDPPLDAPQTQRSTG